MNCTTKEPFEFNKVSYFEQFFDAINYGSKTIQNQLFENCNFKNCNFDSAKLYNCKFIDCEFVGCNLNTISISNTMFSRVIFENSKIMGVNWALAKWPQIKLSSLVNFYSCNISHSSFFGLSLAEINLQGCKAHDVDFREADLSYGDFTNTDFYQSIFVKTNLMGANFSGAINYSIDVTLNEIKKAVFTFPDAVNLLHYLGIKVNGLPNGIDFEET